MSSSTGALKIGVIGCGRMGRHHIQNIQLQNNAEIVAVADPFPPYELLRSILADTTQIYTEAEELFRNTRLDILHIVTPPATHVELAKLALQNDVHIYVEKPFALTAKDASEVIALAEQRNLKICAGHQALSEAATIKATADLTQIGKIIHIESYFSFRPARRNLSTAEQLIDILPHPVYLLVHFLSLASKDKNQAAVHIESTHIRHTGEVRTFLTHTHITAYLTVTLHGRPIEPHIRIIGTHGSLAADYIHGTVIKTIDSGASGLSVVFNPYFQSWQKAIGTTKGLYSRVRRKSKSYVGLYELFELFYSSIRNKQPSPVSTPSILQTVSICEHLQEKILASYQHNEKLAEDQLDLTARDLPTILPLHRIVLTGGTGFLGKIVAEQLRESGWQVIIPTRKIPLFANQVPGAKYIECDLADSIPIDLLRQTEAVVHCAAETAGSIDDHKRNTVEATRNIVEACQKAKIPKFILISSIAVIQTSAEFGRPLDETTPLDQGNQGSGIYIWAKAEAEALASKLCRQYAIQLRVIRPGPIVDFAAFTPPGRLGREIGPFFIAVGKRKSPISVCDVHTAANVICYYARAFSSTPPILNLVESRIPTRSDLVKRFRKVHPGIKLLWVPSYILKLLSPPMILLQKVLLQSKRPVNLGNVFASENYNNALAVRVINEALIKPK